MFQMIVAAISGTDTTGAGAMTANWANISASSDTGISEIVSSTVTFAGGGSRTLEFAHDIRFGSLYVKVDSGAYVLASTGYTKAVTTGQVVYLKYICYYQDESATLTITDNSGPTLVDTVTLVFNFTGVPP